MNRFIYIVIGLFIINIIFSLIPYLAPRAPKDMILPYQLWFNVLFVFAIVLPTSVGNFKLLYK